MFSDLSISIRSYPSLQINYSVIWVPVRKKPEIIIKHVSGSNIGARAKAFVLHHSEMQSVDAFGHSGPGGVDQRQPEWNGSLWIDRKQDWQITYVKCWGICSHLTISHGHSAGEIFSPKTQGEQCSASRHVATARSSMAAYFAYIFPSVRFPPAYYWGGIGRGRGMYP